MQEWQQSPKKRNKNGQILQTRIGRQYYGVIVQTGNSYNLSKMSMKIDEDHFQLLFQPSCWNILIFHLINPKIVPTLCLPFVVWSAYLAVGREIYKKTLLELDVLYHPTSIT